ncbi:hypothetical protein RFI_34220 [Reticulomyxa filosa]|uniref:Uncharacterized protein n=1 Tax=Reticulomyxa filosa TaxID=46433 RepID=X6LR18_RETFI|nr:hypothetical protein RFI_34220 [Reticulomyxa filosa]|eukprot:ETO03190.1 hypothetical protein RFI_34220 [Reticulomyxa filosa]
MAEEEKKSPNRGQSQSQSQSQSQGRTSITVGTEIEWYNLKSSLSNTYRKVVAIYDKILKAERMKTILKDLKVLDLYPEINVSSHLCKIKRNGKDFFDVIFDDPKNKSMLEFVSCVDNESSQYKGGVLHREEFFSEKNMMEIWYAINEFKSAVKDVKKDQLTHRFKASIDGNQMILDFEFPDYAATFFKECELIEYPRPNIHVTHSYNVAHKFNGSGELIEKSTGTSFLFIRATNKSDRNSIGVDQIEKGKDVSNNGTRDKFSPNPKTPLGLLAITKFDGDIITLQTSIGEVLYPMHNQVPEVAQDVLLCIEVLRDKILPRLQTDNNNERRLQTAKQTLINTIKYWSEELAKATKRNEDTQLTAIVNNEQSSNFDALINEKSFQELEKLQNDASTTSVVGSTENKIMKPIDARTILAEHRQSEKGLLNLAIQKALQKIKRSQKPGVVNDLVIDYNDEKRRWKDIPSVFDKIIPRADTKTSKGKILGYNTLHYV